MQVSRQPIPEFTPSIQAAISKGHELKCTELTVKIDTLKQTMGKSNLIAKLFDVLGYSANAQVLQSLQKQYLVHKGLSKQQQGAYTASELQSAIEDLSTALSEIDTEIATNSQQLEKNLPDALWSALGNAPEDALDKRNELLDTQTNLRTQKSTLAEQKEALELTFEPIKQRVKSDLTGAM